MSDRVRLIKVCGLRRSGNHMLIDWMGNSTKQKYLHLNNLWVRGNWLSAFLRLQGNYAEYVHAKVFEQIKSINVPNIIASFEDKSLNSVYLNSDLDKCLDEAFGSYQTTHNVLILRDPFNTFASLLQGDRMKLSQQQQMIDFWKQYARAFIENSGYENLICVNYNIFVTSKNYRNEIAKILKVNSDEASLNSVAYNGSSFDGHNYKGRAREMKVFERWKLLQKSKRYRDLFRDRELIDFSEKIFGHIPGTERIHNKPWYYFFSR